MLTIQNITNDPFQEHIILFNQSEIILTLRFYGLVKCWVCDVVYKNKAIYGIKLSLNTLHITSANLPFDIVIDDRSNSGLDPFKLDDFTTRCHLYLIETDELERYRSVTLEI